MRTEKNTDRCQFMFKYSIHSIVFFSLSSFERKYWNRWNSSFFVLFFSFFCCRNISKRVRQMRCKKLKKKNEMSGFAWYLSCTWNHSLNVSIFIALDPCGSHPCSHRHRFFELNNRMCKKNPINCCEHERPTIALTHCLARMHLYART